MLNRSRRGTLPQVKQLFTVTSLNCQSIEVSIHLFHLTLQLPFRICHWGFRAETRTLSSIVDSHPPCWEITISENSELLKRVEGPRVFLFRPVQSIKVTNGSQPWIIHCARYFCLSPPWLFIMNLSVFVLNSFHSHRSSLEFLEHLTSLFVFLRNVNCLFRVCE